MNKGIAKSKQELESELRDLKKKNEDLQKQLDSYDFSLFGYPKVVENAPIAFTRVLENTQGFALINKEFSRQSGYTREGFNARSEEDILASIHPEDRDGFLKAHGKWCDNKFKDTFRYIYRIINRENKTLWLDVYYYAELDSDGKPYAIDQIYVDITERINAQEKLRESEEKYRMLTDSVPAAIFIFTDNKFVYGNDYSSTLTGYSLDELYKMDFWDMVHPDHKEVAKDRGIARLKGEEVPPRYEIKILDKSGKVKWFDYTGSNIKYSGKSSVLGIAYDITELKNTQQALVDSELKYRTLIESMSEVILYVDNEDKILFVNDNAIRFFGYSKQELIGANAGELLVDKEYRKFISDKLRIRRHGFKDKYEVKMRKKSGELMWVEVSGAPLKDAKGNIIGSIGLHSDISERKQYEDKIEKSLKQKELLLKEIHHRVKNNLQIISSLIKLQSAHIKDNEIHNLFSESQNRIRTMALIHEKLYRSSDLSVIEFYDYIKNLVYSLYSTYGTNIDKVKPVIEFTSIYLDIDTSIPCGLIINELISNCLKYAFPGGKEGSIFINLTESETGNYLMTIRDDGVGIPPQVNFNNTTSLGLKLVKILAEQLGGKAELIRKKGTEFRISFKRLNYLKRT